MSTLIFRKCSFNVKLKVMTSTHMYATGMNQGEVSSTISIVTPHIREYFYIFVITKNRLSCIYMRTGQFLYDLFIRKRSEYDNVCFPLNILCLPCRRYEFYKVCLHHRELQKRKMLSKRNNIPYAQQIVPFLQFH